MNTHVLFAVFRRNFVNYFANPTGYVFICLFVLFSAGFAFCSPNFFGNNLANLDQLSLWFPVIMLFYIPAITMGIWADERKQGTDELLLTIPATDFDIVLGKYLAAVGIFTVSLLFSLVCSYLVLNNLATANGFAVLPDFGHGVDRVPHGVDFGLFLGTYAGYWLVGLAMLAIGLVASFLTGNITIGFVLGVLFNLPLVLLFWADFIGAFSSEKALALTGWSIGHQMHDFSRGMLSLAGVVYFLMILVVMLYVSMALIGRRHWFSGPRRWLQVGHFVVRGLALFVIAVCAVVVLRAHDLRYDVTNEKLSSLSPETRRLIADLKTERPVLIEAFISPSVPEAYVQTRLNLLAALEELRAIGGNKLQVRIHNTDRYSNEAALAEKRYGIQPHQVMSINHGVYSVDQIFLNVAVSRGSSRPIPPAFIDRDTPIEYELVRSICTVTEQKRKKVGVLNTDAQLYGQLNFQTMSPSPNWPIIDELEKQYEVVKVDPSKPITEKYDVLLAVQPSTLGPEEMNNFVAAVAAGQPTAIFEDPAPMLSAVTPTSMPRQPPGGMNPMMRMQSPPKGDINKLWNLLGIDFADAKVVWQDFNPYPKIPDFTKDKEFVFADVALSPTTAFKPGNLAAGTKKYEKAYEEWAATQPFNPADPISSGLQQVLFPFPGFIDKQATSELTFTPLVQTGEKTGTVRYSDLMEMSPFGPRGVNPNRPLNPTGNTYILAAHIQGKVKLPPSIEEPFKNPAAKKAEKKPAEATINVVVATDVDMLSQAFFVLREQGDRPEIGVHFRFDNVTFVLNVLDSLAKDDRFIEIRKRRPAHRMLARIEEETKEAKQAAADSRERFSKKYDEQEQAEQKAIEDKVAELKKQKNMDLQQMAIQVGMLQQDLERQRESKLEQLRREKEREINKIETQLALQVRAVQSWYQLWALLLPPILPLVVAIGVFVIRRVKEREGVAKSRLR
ncbi:MAG: Gldg family protein [Thermoguttaceae bacterium]